MTQSKWNLCAWIGVFTLHTSNIKGFAFKFARASCVDWRLDLQSLHDSVRGVTPISTTSFVWSCFDSAVLNCRIWCVGWPHWNRCICRCSECTPNRTERTDLSSLIEHLVKLFLSKSGSLCVKIGIWMWGISWPDHFVPSLRGGQQHIPFRTITHHLPANPELDGTGHCLSGKSTLVNRDLYVTLAWFGQHFLSHIHSQIQKIPLTRLWNTCVE